jgi:hypothetical protein
MAKTAKTNKKADAKDIRRWLLGLQRQIKRDVVISLLVTKSGSVSFVSCTKKSAYSDTNLDDDDDDDGEDSTKANKKVEQLKHTFNYLG